MDSGPHESAAGDDEERAGADINPRTRGEKAPVRGELDLLQHNPWRLAARQRQRLRAGARGLLLGDALQDAVNVCVRNLRNVPLAVAIARVYEEDDCGPVFRRLLERHIVPHAVERGDRWLACWALSVLEEHDAAMRVIEVRE